jgi:hypothetical protein
MTAKIDREIKLPKTPSWLNHQVDNEKENYRYFKRKDRMVEKATIALILKGSMTGVML